MLRYIFTVIMIYLSLNIQSFSNSPNSPNSPKTTLPKMPLPDIVVGPGGVCGFYSLGICHYVANHFEIKDKNIVGFSAGAFNTLFMRLVPEKRNKLLQDIFECDERNTIHILKRIMDIVETTTELKDYDLNTTSIAVSHPEGISLYDTFLTIEQLVRCCKSSSFIPFVTYETGIDFYNHKIALDGYFYYKSFLSQYPERPLVISPFMFGRYSNTILHKVKFIFGMHALKTTSIYQMYLNGYQDAKKNHSLFDKYLNPLHKVLI